MFFNRELFCEKCHLPVNKKDICTFDYSLQRRNKDGKAIQLCQDCCLNELADNLRKHDSKAVIIQPSDQYNAYAFYSFKVLSAKAEHSINKAMELKYIQDVSSFLPEDGAMCNCCSNAAKYTWCTMNIYNEGNPESMDINLSEKQNRVYLCTDCLIKLLMGKIRDQGIAFRAIYPVVDNETGFYTPWVY